MENPVCYTEFEFLSFDRVALAHTLVSDNYKYHLNNQGYGIYGKTPENGGILEIGFVEENPVVLSGDVGSFLIEENGIFIIPPHCDFSVAVKNKGMHRHTSAEFLLCCNTRRAFHSQPPSGRTVTLPLYIPPSPENGEIFNLIRNIASATAAQPDRSFFEECADFMLLIHKLCQRIQIDDSSNTVSPGNRRHCSRAKAYISQHIDHKLTVGEIAEAIGVSKNYLTNVFSASEGIPLIEYINRSKLSYMVMLIHRYGYTLQQAGKHVGLNDVNYINRIFKRYYGMTVSEYKRSFDQE